MSPASKRRSRGWTVAMAGVVLIGLIGTTPDGTLALSVKPHPRILFSADSLSAVRMRALSGNSPVFEEYKAHVDGRIEDPNHQNSYHLKRYASMYALTGDPRYAQHAIPIAMRMVREGQGIRGESAEGYAGISPVVLTYDWCYPELTEAQKDSIERALLPNLDHPPERKARWLYIEDTFGYMIALAGETNRDEEVMAMLEECIDYLLDYCGPCLDQIAPQGAIDGYGGVRVVRMMALASFLHESTDFDQTREFPYLSFLRNMDKFWMARYRPDFTWTRMPAKYNTSGIAPFYISFFASRLGNPYAQFLANIIISTGHWKDEDLILQAPELLAFHNPYLSALPLAMAPLHYFDPGMGFVLGRTGFAMGSSSRDVTWGFFNGPDTQTHQTQNHFFVSRGADNLIIDSGYRTQDLDDHYGPYYQRAIAHNTVLIDDHSEDFGTYLNSFGQNPPRPNDGGQLVESDRNEGISRWPLCGGTYGYRGEITVTPATPGLIRYEGDATASYWNQKAELVLRALTEQNRDGEQLFLVQDRVVLARPDLAVRSVYHCIDRPVPSGGIVETIEGDPTLVNGGVYRIAGTNIVVVERGNSSARLYFFQADEEDAGEIRLIGGPSRHGLHWRQNVQPLDALTYVSNAADQSYEFWIDGRNYPPRVSSEDFIARRNSPGPDTAGDWRIEYVVEGGGSEVNTACLIHVTERGRSLLPVEATVTGDSICILIGDGDRRFYLSACRPGKTCPGVECGRP